MDREIRLSDNQKTNREAIMEKDLTGREDMQSFELQFLRKLQEHGHLTGFQLVLNNDSMAPEYVLQPVQFCCD